MKFRLNRRDVSMLLVCLCTIQALPAVADSDENTCYINIEPHPCLDDNDPVLACASALEQDPNDLQTRLSLCGAHLQNDDQDRLVNAYIVVSKGLDLCGSNKYVCQRYKYAKSMIEEKEETGPGNESGPDWEDKCKYAKTLCLNNRSNKLSLDGCDRALLCYPNDPSLYVGKGDKLLARKRPAEAVGALTNAIRLDADNEDALATLAVANAERATLAAECVAGISVDVCNRALLPGEADEFDVRFRRGQLLQVEGNQSAALQAFINAQRAKPDDTELAGKLVTLLDPAMGESPDNVEYRRAYGLALLTVGSTDDSIAVLKQAQQMNPDDQDTARILQAARADRSARLERECLSDSDATRCREMILAGEPDESVIREHLARIHRDAGNLDAALTEARKAERLAPGDASIAALIAEVRMLAEPPPPPEPEQPTDGGATDRVVAADQSDQPGPVIETAAADADQVADPVPVTFSNAARNDGRTY